MPSSPSLQACRNTVAPSPSMCSLNRMPVASLGKHGCERGLADFERIAPQVVASSHHSDSDVVVMQSTEEST